MNNHKSHPLLILAFNRPHFVQALLDSLDPTKLDNRPLYISIDGPRNDEDRTKGDEIIKILETFQKKHHIKFTVWRSKTNQGCRIGVSSAISRVLDIHESIIILEDDCIPSKSFIPYCDYLLEVYKNDASIAMINGSTFLQNQKGYSYRPSKCAFVWGWATWRRAWEKYDQNMSDCQSNTGHNVKKKILDHFDKYGKNLIGLIDKVHRQNIDTWDAQWAYAIWKNQWNTIVPSMNLIQNIGFGESATHTKIILPIAERKSHEMPDYKKKRNLSNDEIRELDRAEYESMIPLSSPGSAIRMLILNIIYYGKTLFVRRKGFFGCF